MPTSFRAAFACLALAGSLPACQLALGPPETCGAYPSGGGPAVIASRDQELCELVRLRVSRSLERTQGLELADVQQMLSRAARWDTERDVEQLVEQIRRDANDEVANDVERAIAWVLEHSAKPLPADCPDVQRCLARGAAKGARLALEWAEWRLSTTSAPVSTEKGPVQIGDRPAETDAAH